MYNTDTMSISISMYIHIQKMKPETSVQVVPMLENHTVVTKVVLQVVFYKAFPAFPLPPISVFFRSPAPPVFFSPSPTRVLSSHLCRLLSSSFQVSSPLPPPSSLIPSLCLLPHLCLFDVLLLIHLCKTELALLLLQGA